MENSEEDSPGMSQSVLPVRTTCQRSLAACDSQFDFGPRSGAVKKSIAAIAPRLWFYFQRAPCSSSAIRTSWLRVLTPVFWNNC